VGRDVRVDVRDAGFHYDSAEQAEARFLNLDPGFQYSRFSNPTVAMFEERMALLEGARWRGPRRPAWPP
jgi:O-acetylhomoserine sulfhydrylase